MSYFNNQTEPVPPTAGEGYESLQPVVGIHLVDFELFPVADQALWCFDLHDRMAPRIRLEEKLQLHLLKLPKVDRLRQGERAAPWLRR